MRSHLASTPCPSPECRSANGPSIETLGALSLTSFSAPNLTGAKRKKKAEERDICQPGSRRNRQNYHKAAPETCSSKQRSCGPPRRYPPLPQDSRRHHGSRDRSQKPRGYHRQQHHRSSRHSRTPPRRHTSSETPLASPMSLQYGSTPASHANPETSPNHWAHLLTSHPTIAK